MDPLEITFAQLEVRRQLEAGEIDMATAEKAMRAIAEQAGSDDPTSSQNNSPNSD
jgi:predicted xylose isomerase-like sugar epimerase